MLLFIFAFQTSIECLTSGASQTNTAGRVLVRVVSVPVPGSAEYSRTASSIVPLYRSMTLRHKNITRCNILCGSLASVADRATIEHVVRGKSCCTKVLHRSSVSW